MVHDFALKDSRESGVIVNAGYGPVEVLANAGRAAGLKIKRCLSVFDENHKFNPKFAENETKDMQADVIIFAIGQTADLKPFPQLEKSSGNRLVVDEVTLNTSVWNVFAAGDAVTGPSSVISAIGGGREAAISIDRLMRGAHMHSDRVDARPDVENLPGKGVLAAPRNSRKNIQGKDFSESRQGFDSIEALDESMRCMTCGAKAKIAYRDDCMTCYFCDLRCPADAIDVFPFKERLPYTIESNTHAW